MITEQLLLRFMHPSWVRELLDEFHKEYMVKLSKRISEERRAFNIYPQPSDVFKTYELGVNDVKILILGQDPYHTPEVANGLAFSYKNTWGQPLPPSLKNIFKEAEKSTGLNLNYEDGDLSRWHKQGVFLLNTVLTVRQGEPNSHKTIGWLRFTAETIRVLGQREDPIVFMLWGKNALSYRQYIEPHHHVLIASHPSPFSYELSFKDCNHFHDANMMLSDMKKKPIDWR